MASYLGANLMEFNEGEEKFSVYLERFENFIECNEIKEEKKKAVFLTVIGAKLYALLKSLCVPDCPQKKKYEELKNTLLNHLEPEGSTIVERYKFNQRSQNNNESIAEYLAALKKLSIHCKFSERLNEMIRDRFIAGLTNKKIKMKLLNEPEQGMTLQKAVEIAMTMEKTEKNIEEMRDERGSDKIMKMEKKIEGNGQGQWKGGRSAGGNGNRTGKQGRYYGKEQAFQSFGQGNQRNEQEIRRAESCNCCGRMGHRKLSCWFKDRKCRECGIVGHLQSVCRRRQNYVQEDREGTCYEDQDYEENSDNLFSMRVNMQEKEYVEEQQKKWQEEKADEENQELFAMRSGLLATYKVKLIVCNVHLQMEIDTGSVISAISRETYKRYFNNMEMVPCDLKLKSYTDTPLNPLGYILVTVKHGQQCYKELPLYIFENGGPPLVGRDWLKVINLLRFHSLDFDSKNIQEKLKKRFPKVFTSSLGTYKGDKIELKLKENSCPKYFKARPLPFSMKELVEKEINRLVQEGILSPVQAADWASPIVPVLKENGKLRICGDFKITINPYLEDNRHPIPRIEDLFVDLQKGQKFSKIDLAHAYQQCLISDESKKLVIINTHMGLFAYNRLPFGIKTAPNIFQSIMDQLFKGIAGDSQKQGIATFLDDIVITGKDDHEHMQNLLTVITKLAEVGLTVNIEKCIFMAPSIRYLGYVLSSEGLLPDKRNVEAILNAPEPQNLTELKSLLGMINYYLKFIPNAASILAPFYKLTKKNVEFCFNDQCKKAFVKVKDILSSPQVLAHYDPSSDLFLACDASAYGLGAVLSQKKNGIERPIAYASRTLTKSEINYSQVDKEALALIFGVKKFNQYLWGKKFTLLTDSKPLLSIFGPKKGIPVLAAGRMQRYAFILSGYDYNIIYVRSEHNNADFFSRLPLQRIGKTKVEYTYLNFIKDNSFLPLDCNQIKKETLRDPILKDVLQYILNGWPNYVGIPLQSYFSRKEQLTVEQGIIMYGHRVVIPATLIKIILKELHSTHLGIVKMKSLARSYFWWLSIDKDIELLANSCSTCLSLRQNPEKTTLHSWEYPKAVWSRLHIDYLGPCFGKMYLVIQCVYSKWIEVAEVPSTSAFHAVAFLKKLFTTFGYPELLCSDNGPPFHSEEFKEFLKSCGVRQVFSPPYHPQSNGCAESAVKIVKNCIKKAVMEKKNVNDSLCNFLMLYRNSQHSATCETPAKLMFNRNLRTRFDLLKPDLRTTVQRNQEKQKFYARGREVKEYQVGQNVLARSYREGKWIEGVIIKQLGPVTYLIKLLDTGVIWKRHVDQLTVFESMRNDVDDDDSLKNVPVKENISKENNDNLAQNVQVDLAELEIEDNVSESKIVNEKNNISKEDLIIVNSSKNENVTTPRGPRVSVQNVPERRYPKRIVKKPVRLDL